MALIPVKCPNCGANLRIDPANDVATCEYCQTSSFVKTRTRHVTQQIARQYPTVIDASSDNRAMLVIMGIFVLVGVSAAFAATVIGVGRRGQAAAAAPTAIASAGTEEARPERQYTIAEVPNPPEVEVAVPAASINPTRSSVAPGAKRDSKLKAVSTVRAGAITVSGRLSSDVVQRAVRTRFGRFRMCHEQGLARKPDLQGRVTVRFVIGRDGSVSHASNGGSELGDSGVVSCVMAAFSGLQFPAPEGGIVTVSYPLMFSPG